MFRCPQRECPILDIVLFCTAYSLSCIVWDSSGVGVVCSMAGGCWSNCGESVWAKVGVRAND